METIINMVLSNPVYMAIAVIIIIILVYALIKKIIKLIIGIGIALVFYAFYLHYTGKELPANIDDLKTSVSEGVNEIKETASESIIDVKKSTKKIVEKKVDAKIDEIFSD